MRPANVQKSAKNLACMISGELNTDCLSSFKRNDILSKALGHKGYSDLVFSSKFRAQVKQPVKPIFSDKNYIQSIAHAFSSEVKGLSYAQALRLCRFIRLEEAVDVKVTTLMLSLESKLKALPITAEECERLRAISLSYTEAIVLIGKQSDIALKMIYGDSEQLKEELSLIQNGMKRRSKEISFLLKVTKSEIFLLLILSLVLY
tara:strand:+ start:22 stop:633 length:612 start_codon:yes stop_codon:yes gene_type:complete